MEITDLTRAELRVWRAFPLNEGVDLRESADDDPADGASWGPGRTVRAKVLQALLLDGPATGGEVPGLKLTGARITGRLDLMYGTVEHAVRLRSCHFEQPPNLYGARMRALVLSDSVLPRLTAGTLRVDIVLRMTGCRVTGPVRLAGAQLSGALFLDGAVLGVPGAQDGRPPGPEREGSGERPEPVLQLDHATVGTDVWAAGLTAYGRVRMDGATIGGLVNLDDAELHDPGGLALEAETLAVGTDLRAARLRARGMVNLSGATIPRRLVLNSARLSNPAGQALRVSACAVGELWLRGAAPVRGTVNLRGARLDLLDAVPEVWPERVRLDGLTYRRLTPHLPAERRLPLLEREETGHLPYSYEQLATAYRTAGDEAGARTVQLAKLRRHRRSLPPYARFWGHLQDATVGYGFRPMRAGGWLLALLLAGTLVFAGEHPRPLKADEAPDFTPLFYTLDLLLPVIGFGQEAAFAPQGAYQWLAYLLVVTGWILATTTAAGITRALSRQ
ncbi:membrane-associated oxidoreductase [Streptomyces sp. HK10]|uniref:membrane-associated oxidoreductase n=1 Tax=Streptomyces sp. HK10 TaxID=3373255 RepID=UPI0037499ACA